MNRTTSLRFIPLLVLTIGTSCFAEGGAPPSARQQCLAAGAERRLAGAALDSFMRKCLSDFKSSPSPPDAADNPPSVSTFGQIINFNCNQWAGGLTTKILVQTLYPSDKRQHFADQTFTKNLVDSIRNNAIQRCAGVPSQIVDGRGRNVDAQRTGFDITIGATRDFGWYVGNTQNIYVRGSFDLQTHKWTYFHNAAAEALAEEMRELREQEARQAEERKRQEEAIELEKRKQAALADCGSNWPTLISGPWFSSTYKTAAIDGARRSNYLCVKSLEYLGPAPNPFGGNGAKARIIFYANNAERREQIIDFFY